jgi:hypothetical protein
MRAIMTPWAGVDHTSRGYRAVAVLPCQAGQVRLSTSSVVDMAKVYISSTFRDLRRCREQVAEAVRPGAGRVARAAQPLRFLNVRHRVLLFSRRVAARSTRPRGPPARAAATNLSPARRRARSVAARSSN